MSDGFDYIGNIRVGTKGEKQFGNFNLFWTARIDGIDWTLVDLNKQDSNILEGYLKYVGWNRISIPNQPMALSKFEIYVHEWPSIKQAIDYIYYELGFQISAGTYQDNFIKP